MKSSVRATSMYSEATDLVAVLTQYMAFLNTEPTKSEMQENIGKLEDVEAHLLSLLAVVTNAKLSLDEMFKVAEDD